MYSKAQPQRASGAGPSGGGNSSVGGRDEGAIDAEYTDVEQKQSAWFRVTIVVERGPEACSARLRSCCRVYKMSHHGRTADIAVDALFNFSIRADHALVLPRMFGPGID
jgi:hypothetical protein